MKSKTIRFVECRRKREGKTNYKNRLAILKSQKKRLVVRKSLNNILLQIIRFEEKGDKVEVCAHSNEIKKLGWKFHTGNIPCAYLTGYLLAAKAKKAGIKDAVLDIGMNTSTKSSRIYAALKGAVDGGLNVPHSEDILPDCKKLSGEHIASFFAASKSSAGALQFKNYQKQGLDAKDMKTNVDELKKKIA